MKLPNLEEVAREMQGRPAAQAEAALRTAEILERLATIAPNHPALRPGIAKVAEALRDMLLLLLDPSRPAATAQQLAECAAILSLATGQLDELEKRQAWN